MDIFHSSIIGGHFGMQPTSKRLGGLLYWKGLEKGVQNYIRDCDVCQQCKYDNAATPGMLQSLHVPEGL